MDGGVGTPIGGGLGERGSMNGMCGVVTVWFGGGWLDGWAVTACVEEAEPEDDSMSGEEAAMDGVANGPGAGAATAAGVLLYCDVE